MYHTHISCTHVELFKDLIIERISICSFSDERKKKRRLNVLMVAAHDISLWKTKPSGNPRFSFLRIFLITS